MSIRIKASILLIITYLTLLFSITMRDAVNRSEAQSDETSNIKTLLERLLVEDDLSISLIFINPVSDGRIDWVIPDYGQGGTGERYVTEIGDDYICAEEVGEGVSATVCVPFSNIAYIYYIKP